MKVKNIEEEETFKPVKIEIVFETEEEAKAFYSIFNSGPICSWGDNRGVRSSEIRKAILDAGIDRSSASALNAYLKSSLRLISTNHLT